MNLTLDELYNILYSDTIHIPVNEYGDTKIIYKNKSNFNSSDNNLIHNYAIFYNLNNDETDTIKNIINQFIWCNAVMTIQDTININLEDEANKIYEAIDTIQNSKIFKSDEPNYDDCYITIIKRYTGIANNLIALYKEKTHINPSKNIKDEMNDNNYIYSAIKKYPNLNPLIVLSAFKQSKKTLATELFFNLKNYIVSTKNLKNTKETKITTTTIDLIKALFDIKVNDRDRQNTNEYLSITRYFLLDTNCNIN